MAWFKIYCGMGGSMGGARYNGTYKYADIDEATADAYRMAEEEYQSYEGHHGIMSWDDCYEDLMESNDGIEPSDDDVSDHYREEIESWIRYYALPATGPDDQDEE